MADNGDVSRPAAKLEHGWAKRCECIIRRCDNCIFHKLEVARIDLLVSWLEGRDVDDHRRAGANAPSRAHGDAMISGQLTRTATLP
jgi:hypothetical protein